MRIRHLPLLLVAAVFGMGVEPCQPPPPPDPVHLDNADLYLNLGDSVAQGYNADPRDRLSYKKLLLQNDTATYPGWAGRDLATRFPGIRFYDFASSGDQSKDVLNDQLPSAKSKTAAVGVLAVVFVGGNDFNDNFGWSVVDGGRTLKTNLTQIANQLRNNPRWAGLPVQVVISNFYEPTDDVGTIFGSGYEGLVGDSGMCKIIQSPLAGLLRPTYLSFMGKMAEAAQATGADLVDAHGHYLGHGFWHLHADNPSYNPADPTLWISLDCTHANNRGHQELRRLLWYAVTKEWFDG